MLIHVFLLDLMISTTVTKSPTTIATFWLSVRILDKRNKTKITWKVFQRTSSTMEGKHSQVWEVFRGLSVCPKEGEEKEKGGGKGCWKEQRNGGWGELRGRLGRREGKGGGRKQRKAAMKEEGRWWQVGGNVGIFDCAAPACLRMWRSLLDWILFLLFHKSKSPTLSFLGKDMLKRFSQIPFAHHWKEKWYICYEKLLERRQRTGEKF